MRFVFEDSLRYNHFFFGFGLSKLKLSESTDRIEHETLDEISGLKNRFSGIENRLSKQ
jgi:hypothetical protein